MLEITYRALDSIDNVVVCDFKLNKKREEKEREKTHTKNDPNRVFLEMIVECCVFLSLVCVCGCDSFTSGTLFSIYNSACLINNEHDITVFW